MSGAVKRSALSALLLVLLLGLLPASARAHQQLLRAQPAADAVAAVVPRQLRLAFAEPIDLSFTQVALVGPDGASLPVGPLRLASDSPTVLVVPISRTLAAGEYTVRWSTVGSDGHPVRGQYSFSVAEDAHGLDEQPPTGATEAADTGAAAPVSHDEMSAGHQMSGMVEMGGFSSESPAYVVVRWVSYIALLGVIGAVAFALLVLGAVRRRGGADERELIVASRRRAAGAGVIFAALLILSGLARLYAQSLAMHGAEGALEGERIAAILTGTVWGSGWILQMAGALLAGLGFVLARRGTWAGWMVAAVAVLALAVSPALAGHAASMSGLIGGVAIGVDALHVLAAGGWIGSLLILLAAGVPAALRLGRARRGLAVAALVRAYSPTALMFASLLVLSGVGAILIHNTSLSALLASRYGTVLLIKLGIFLLVFFSGAYNYLRVQPALGGDTGTNRLRRSAGFEVALGAAVLLVTAVLVATARPHEEVSPAGTQASAESGMSGSQ